MGIIFNLQRLSLHDGPGVRTTVFLKGCPLKCKWCHNPEGINRDTQLQFSTEKCIGCGKCAEICTKGGHTFTDGNHEVDFEKCTMCNGCVTACPSTALEASGSEVTVEQVLNDVARDQAFFGKDGGVTFSGGEPMMQIEFLLELLKEAKKRGFDTAVDTSGFAPWKHYESTLPYVDQYLYDIKGFDQKVHIEATGVSNKVILSNLVKLSDAGKRIHIRMPLIKEYNTNLDDLREIANYLSNLNIIDLTLMPYHVFGRSKNELIGRESSPALTPPSSSEVEKIRQIFLDKNITLSQ